MDDDWKEELHPRDENGKFSSKGSVGKTEQKPETIDILHNKQYNSNEREHAENRPKKNLNNFRQREADVPVVDKLVKETHLSKEAVENLIHDIKNESVHNTDAEHMLLGKGHGGGGNSYVNKAEKAGDMYFSMGDDWEETKQRYKLDDDQMFDVFNAAAIDFAMENGKKIRFCDEPRDDGSGLGREVKYLKKKYNVIFMKKGDYWYAK